MTQRSKGSVSTAPEASSGLPSPSYAPTQIGNHSIESDTAGVVGAGTTPGPAGCEVNYAPVRTEAQVSPLEALPGVAVEERPSAEGAKQTAHLPSSSSPLNETPSEPDATNPSPDPTPSLWRDLMALLGPSQVSERQTDRRSYARDLWPLQLLRSLYHQPPPLPAVIVWPRSEAEVVGVVGLARRHRCPLTPFGGGSGVLGGAMPSPNGLVMDLKRMDFVGKVDPLSATVVVGPGVLGWHLEEKLKAQGYTLGHFPSSLMTATVGGYVATRSAGQFSSRYGKIEDMVTSLRFVTGTGEIIDTEQLSPASTLDLCQIILGSEGTLGVVTSIRLRVHRAPSTALYRGIRFHSLEQGLNAMRAIMQAGLRPSVLRLYDELDTFLVGRGDKPLPEKPSQASPLAGAHAEPHAGSHADAAHAPSESAHSGGEKSSIGSYLKSGARSLLDRFPQVARSAVRVALGRPALLEAAVDRFLPHDLLLILGCEGEPEEVEATLESMLRLSHHAGGQDLGPEPGERWLKKRYDVSFKMPTFFYHGAFVDTVEVAATWEHIPALYHAVRHAVADQVMIMAHFSHAYPEGLSIYFSLGGSADSLETAEQRYHTAWKNALAVVHQAGGTVSHHHGVGQMKAAQVMEEQGPFVERWQHLKRYLDPDGILNPGKLFPLTSGQDGSSRA